MLRTILTGVALLCVSEPLLLAETVADLLALIAPAKTEQAWLAIPWETNLSVARRKAGEQNRPIFLWEMDGHPLGCT